MFYTIPYREGWVQHSTIDGKNYVYAQFWRDGEFCSVKATDERHAKNLISRNRTRTRKQQEAKLK